MTSDRSTAAAWDAEYHTGRYLEEPPVAFTGDILTTAQQAGLTRGLYIGCGNGRNYLPLVAAGLDLTGLDISATAIGQLTTRMPKPPRPSHLRRPHRAAARCPLAAGHRHPGLPARER